MVRRAWSRRWVRALVALVVVVVAAAGVGVQYWWTHPPTRSVPLPAGVERGKMISLGGSLPAVRTRTGGDLSSGGLQSESHEWLGVVRWRSGYGPRSKSEVYRLHLGESVHIDGLGTLTLLSVNLDSGAEKDEDGGLPNQRFNLVLDPGVELRR